jgi:hypothetical protein
MKKLLLILLLPLSIITVTTAQKKTNEELLPAVSIQDYFNYVKLDEVFEVFKKKYNFKIEYNKEDIPSQYFSGFNGHYVKSSWLTALVTFKPQKFKLTFSRSIRTTNL